MTHIWSVISPVLCIGFLQHQVPPPSLVCPKLTFLFRTFKVDGGGEIKNEEKGKMNKWKGGGEGRKKRCT
jgi:hypothetical protein